MALTDLDLAIEVEMLYALKAADPNEEPELRTCDQCDGQTYRSYCPWCPDAAPLTLLERLVAREERGEEVDWKTEYDDVVWGQIDQRKAKK